MSNKNLTLAVVHEGKYYEEVVYETIEDILDQRDSLVKEESQIFKENSKLKNKVNNLEKRIKEYDLVNSDKLVKKMKALERKVLRCTEQVLIANNIAAESYSELVSLQGVPNDS